MPNPITIETRQRLRDLGAQTAEVAGEAFTEFLFVRRSLEAQGPTPEAAVLNGVEFFLLLQHDFASLLADLATHTGTLRGNLYARLILLTVHESCLTMESILARPFREQLVAAIGRAEADSILRQVHSDAITLYRRSERDFGEVRDGIVAHRDRDAEVRARLIAATEEEQIAQLAIDLLDILHRLSPLIREYIGVLRRRLAPVASA